MVQLAMERDNEKKVQRRTNWLWTGVVDDKIYCKEIKKKCPIASTKNISGNK